MLVITIFYFWELSCDINYVFSLSRWFDTKIISQFALYELIFGHIYVYSSTVHGFDYIYIYIHHNMCLYYMYFWVIFMYIMTIICVRILLDSIIHHFIFVIDV